jgi:hypothetical protein
MNDASEQRLAKLVHGELRRLPDRRAPVTLAPRVMAALAARQQAPWWRQSWSHWPPGMRLAFLNLCLALAGGLVMVGLQLPPFNELTSELTRPLLGWIDTARPYGLLLLRLGDAVWLVVKSAPPHVLWLCAAAVGLGYAFCVGLGTLGYRVALNRI